MIRWARIRWFVIRRARIRWFVIRGRGNYLEVWTSVDIPALSMAVLDHLATTMLLLLLLLFVCL